MTRCEYIERKTQSKNILEFSNTFSLDHIINFILDHPVYKHKNITEYGNNNKLNINARCDLKPNVIQINTNLATLMAD